MKSDEVLFECTQCEWYGPAGQLNAHNKCPECGKPVEEVEWASDKAERENHYRQI